MAQHLNLTMELAVLTAKVAINKLQENEHMT
jgi:hypothetical protein